MSRTVLCGQPFKLRPRYNQGSSGNKETCLKKPFNRDDLSSHIL